MKLSKRKNTYRKLLNKCKKTKINIIRKYYKYYETSSGRFLSKYYLHKLSKMFLEKKFKELFRTIEEIKQKSENEPFPKSFPNEDKKIILYTYYKFMKARWIIKKMLYKRKVRKHLKKIKPTNLCTLELEPLENIPEDEKIYVYYNNPDSFYVFHYKNLITTFRIMLECEEYGYPTPKKLINPYTNIKFTEPQIISIFDRFNTILKKKNERLPTTLVLFSETKNIHKFLKRNIRYLSFKACKRYVIDLNDSEFDILLKNYIDDFFKNELCFTCIKNELTSYRKIFEPAMVKYIIASNIFKTSIEHFKMVEKLIDNYNLSIDDKNHFKKHRELIRAVRRNLENSFINQYSESSLDVNPGSSPGSPVSPENPQRISFHANTINMERNNSIINLQHTYEYPIDIEGVRSLFGELRRNSIDSIQYEQIIRF